MTDGNRDLTEDERRLVRWMLEHGDPGAIAFLPQLDRAVVTPTPCPCGCASLDFEIRGMPKPKPGIHPIADFLFGDDDNLGGIFVYENEGILSGLEVYGFTTAAAKSLPRPEDLRPFGST